MLFRFDLFGVFLGRHQVAAGPGPLHADLDQPAVGERRPDDEVGVFLKRFVDGDDLAVDGGVQTR